MYFPSVFLIEQQELLLYIFVSFLQIAQLKNEISLLSQSEGANTVFRTVNLPEGMVPSSVNMINSLNEYLIRLVQVTHLLLDVRNICNMQLIPPKSSTMPRMDMRELAKIILKV